MRLDEFDADCATPCLRMTRVTLLIALIALFALGGCGAAARPSLSVMISYRAPGFGGIAVGAGSIWAVNQNAEQVIRIDQRTGATLATVSFGPNASQELASAAFASGMVWVGSFANDAVTEIDPATNSVVKRITELKAPADMLAIGDTLWIAEHHGGTLTRINASTGQVVATVTVGPPGLGGPASLATADDKTIWVGIPNSNTLVAVDAATNSVVRRIHLHLTGGCQQPGPARLQGRSGSESDSAVPATSSATTLAPSGRQRGSPERSCTARAARSSTRMAASGSRPPGPPGVPRRGAIDLVNPAHATVTAPLQLNVSPDGVSFAPTPGGLWVRTDGRVYRVKAG